MWAGHSLFHMVTDWSSVWPTMQRFALDIGITGLGEPRWTALPALLTPDSLLALQLFFSMRGFC